MTKKDGENLAAKLYMDGAIDVSKFSAAMRIFDRNLSWEVEKTIKTLKAIEKKKA